MNKKYTSSILVDLRWLYHYATAVVTSIYDYNYDYHNHHKYKALMLSIFV